MSAHLDISIVMAAYNGERSLPETLDGILRQRGVEFEVVVVNDGSTDGTARVLEEYSCRDARLRVISQENTGLTVALRRGCAVARGTYIARHDVGDLSAPTRLSKQLELIGRTPEAAFVSCGTRFVGPGGEYLYEIVQDPAQAQARLEILDVRKVGGPAHHGSTLFPRALYEKVGGYRPDFYFAQDLDLWLRMSEHSRHVVLPEVLYQASISVGSISGTHRKEQIKTAECILESARRRRRGEDDGDVLTLARVIRPGKKKRASRLSRAEALYFIGTCLENGGNPKSAQYYRRALFTCPVYVRSAVRLLLNWL